MRKDFICIRTCERTCTKPGTVYKLLINDKHRCSRTVVLVNNPQLQHISNKQHWSYSVQTNSVAILWVHSPICICYYFKSV